MSSEYFPLPEKERRRGCPYPGCREPEQAAVSAVKRVFEILGVNVDDPKQVEEFREDLRFGGQMRKLANRGIVTLVIATALFIAGATGIGIAAKCKSIWEIFAK